MGIASATLALMTPDDYCVIDFRGWRALFSEERSRRDSTSGIEQV